MRSKTATGLALAFGVSAALLNGAVQAAEADAEEATLTEVVVTAEKTSEPLSKVPISISVISGQTLEDEHITDYADLSRAVPDLSFSSDGGPGQNNIEIRGVSSQAGSATTGIYLDDVPINILNIYTAGATEPRFFDIDRVEVLRGPQGTIYGSSSMGGTIHFVSNAPDLSEYHGDVHSSVGGTEDGGINYESDGVLNVPLEDGKAALRVGALYDHESGYIDRVSPSGGIVASNINNNNTTVIRATLEWRPVDALTITPAVFLQRLDAGGQDVFGLALPRFESPTLVPEASRDEYAVNSLTVNYDFGWSDLTSVTGYFWRTDDRLIDGTFYDSVYIGESLQQEFGYGGAAISALAAPAEFDTNVNQFHQEVRLASKPSGPDDHWSWIGGLYYSRTRTGLLDDEHIPGFNSVFEATYDNTPLNVLGAAFPDDLVYYAFTEFIDSEEAVFGQVSYKITPALKLTAGARYERATEDLTFVSAGYFASGAPFSGTADGTATTPKVAASYDINDLTMVYASAAKGYRDGGINRPVPIPLCSADLATLGLTQAPPSYKSDSLWSYELGGKTHTTDNSTVLSGAVYDIRWDDIQTDIILPTCTFDIKDNIGSAEVKGVELELAQRFGEHLSMSAGGNYTAAKVTEPVTILGVEKGDHVPGVPEWLLSSAFQYAQPVMNGGQGYARLNGQWIGPSQGTIIHGDPDFYRPGYFVMGGGTGVRFANYEVNLFVTNLLNGNKVIQRPNIADVEYGLTVRPRTYGVGGTYSF
jgi:outer membrane receptor protein involved in Fe transport